MITSSREWPRGSAIQGAAPEINQVAAPSFYLNKDGKGKGQFGGVPGKA